MMPKTIYQERLRSMNLLSLKGLIYQSDILHYIAEVVLDIYISLRYKITGGYRQRR